MGLLWTILVLVCVVAWISQTQIVYKVQGQGRARAGLGLGHPTALLSNRKIYHAYQEMNKAAN